MKSFVSNIKSALTKGNATDKQSPDGKSRANVEQRADLAENEIDASNISGAGAAVGGAAATLAVLSGLIKPGELNADRQDDGEGADLTPKDGEKGAEAPFGADALDLSSGRDGTARLSEDAGAAAAPATGDPAAAAAATGGLDAAAVDRTSTGQGDFTAPGPTTAGQVLSASGATSENPETETVSQVSENPVATEGVATPAPGQAARDETLVPDAAEPTPDTTPTTGPSDPVVDGTETPQALPPARPIILDAADLAEGSSAATLIATLEPGSPADGDVRYEIVGPDGQPFDHPAFEIVGSEVRVKDGADINYEDIDSYELSVIAINDNGSSAPQGVTIEITDVAEVIRLDDTGESFVDTGVTETAIIGGSGDDVIRGGADGSDLRGGAGADEIIAGAGDDALMGGRGDDILTGGAGTDSARWTGDISDYAITFDSATGTFGVTDLRGGSGDEGTDTVRDVEEFIFGDQTFSRDEMITEAERQANTAPEAPTIASGGTVAEDAVGGVTVAELEAVDADGDVLTYQLTDAAGAPITDSHFEIVGTEIRVKPGATFDFETDDSYALFVTVSDRFETSPPEAFTISVEDLAEVIALADGGDSFVETGVTETAIIGGAGDDTITGAAGDDVMTGGAGDDALTGGAGTDTAIFSGNRWDYTITDNGDGSYDIVDLRPGSPDGTDKLTGIEVLRFADGDIAPDDAVNVAPELEADDGTITENDAGAVVGAVTATDANAGDTQSFSVDDARFEIVDGQLKLKDGESLDYETDGDTVSVTVTVTDREGATDSEVVTVSVADTAETITLVDGGDSFVDSGTGETAIVGGNGDDTIIATDDDADITGGAGDDTLTGGAGDDLISGGTGSDSLTGGAGDDILTGGAGNDLVTGGDGTDIAVFTGDWRDYTVTDNGDGSFTVTDDRPGSPDGADTYTDVEVFRFGDGDVTPADAVNDGPTVNAADGSINENAAGAVVGVVTESDPDAGDSVTLSVDDARFEIVGGQLKLKDGESLDYEVDGSSVSVTVTATDSHGATDTDVVTVSVADQAEVITLADGGATFVESGVTETAIQGGTGDDAITGASGSDAMAGGAGADVLTGGSGDDTLTGGAGDDTIDGGADSDTAIWDGPLGDFSIAYDTGNDTFTITDLNASDGDEGTDTVSNIETFTFDGVDYTKADIITEADRQANTAPGQATVASGGDVDENAADGTVVATLEATDIDGDTLSYQITDAAGAPISDSNFEIVGNEIRVKPGADLDFETATSHDLFIVASDDYESAAPQAITVTVNDVAEHIILENGGDTFTESGVTESSIQGGSGDDLITGSNTGDDNIDGWGGNDHIATGGGDDTLYGGDGEDALYAGSGDDELAGYTGDDALFGGDGTDTAVWDGDLSDYAISYDSGTDTFTVTDLDTGDGLDLGTDTVNGVEFFTFDDTVLTKDEMITEADRQANAAPTDLQFTGNPDVAATQDGTPTHGNLAHQYDLEGDGADSVGGNDGTLYNGPTTVAGRDGDALRFDEVDDYVRIPDVEMSNEFTVTFQFRLDDNDGSLFQYMYSHGNINGPDSLNVFVTEASHGTDPNMLRTVMRDSDDTLDNFMLEFDISDVVGDGEWHTYTLTVENGVGSRVYLDGVLQNSDARGGDSFDPTGDVFLGGREDLDAGRFFGGELDTVQIYDRPLSEIEVGETHGAGPATIADGTVVGSVAGVVDSDDASGHTFALTDDAGGKVSIDPDTGDITLVGAHDADTTFSDTITVEVTDPDGATYEETFGLVIGGEAGGDTITGPSDQNIIYSLGGDDTVTGGTGDDMMFGGTGDDLLEGSAGNDTLAGGDGTDTAVWEGDRADFDIAYDSGTDTFTITDLTAADGDEGVDTVAGVETFVFGDVTYTKAQLIAGPGTAPTGMTFGYEAAPIVAAPAVVTGEITANGDGDGSVDRWSLTHDGGDLNIDVLAGGYEGGNLDSVIHLLRDNGDGSFTVVATNDDGALGDDGSVSGYDSFLSVMDLSAGDYVLAIGGYPLSSGDAAASGDYQSGGSGTGPYQITLDGDVTVNGIATDPGTGGSWGDPGDAAAIARATPAVPAGTEVAQVTGVTDADAGDTQHFALVGGSGTYEIDPETGVITLASDSAPTTVDQETLTVRVTDGGGNTYDADVTITVGTDAGPRFVEINGSNFSDTGSGYTVTAQNVEGGSLTTASSDNIGTYAMGGATAFGADGASGDGDSAVTQQIAYDEASGLSENVTVTFDNDVTSAEFDFQNLYTASYNEEGTWTALRDGVEVGSGTFTEQGAGSGAGTVAIDGIGTFDTLVFTANQETDGSGSSDFGLTAVRYTDEAVGDVLTGGSGADIIHGLGGDDALSGGAGDDVLVGGDGDDAISGGDGTDVVVFAGARSGYEISYDPGTETFTIRDTVGGGGEDTVSTVETFRFADGDYTTVEMIDEAERQANSAPTEIDFATGGSVNETVDTGGDIGSAFDPSGSIVATLETTDDAGDTHIYSLVSDPSGKFEIIDDTIRVKAGQTIDFETDQSFDLVVRSTDQHGETFDQLLTLDVNDYEGFFAGSDAGAAVVGTSEEDLMYADADGSTLDGGAGDDTLVGDDAADHLSGGAGDDTLYGGAGRDTLFGGDGDDILDGGTGADTFDGGEGSDIIRLHEKDFSISNIVTDSGSSGHDVIELTAGSGTYRVQGDFSADTGIEEIRGTSGGGEELGTKDSNANFDFTDITINGVDQIIGTSNSDTIIGSAGADTISTGSGNDTLDGGFGDDVLKGGDGDDLYAFGAGMGDDTIIETTGWTDMISLDGMGSGATVSGNTVDGDGWTLILDSGHTVDGMTGDQLDLSADAAGVISFDDGGSVDFVGIERVTW